MKTGSYIFINNIKKIYKLSLKKHFKIFILLYINTNYIYLIKINNLIKILNYIMFYKMISLIFKQNRSHYPSSNIFGNKNMKKSFRLTKET